MAVARGMRFYDLLLEQKYAEARSEVQAASEDEMDTFAMDALYRVGMCFGSEKNEDLISLLRELGRFGSGKERVLSLTELAKRDSPHLMRTALDMIVDDFDKLPEKQQRHLEGGFCWELEGVLLGRVEEAGERGEDRERTECMRALTTLRAFATAIRSQFRFTASRDVLVCEVDVENPSGRKMICHMCADEPFHPMALLVHETNSTPCVYSVEFEVRERVRCLGDWLAKYQRRPGYGNAVSAAMDGLLDRVEGARIEADQRVLKVFSGLLFCVEDFGLEEVRVRVMQQMKRLMHLCDRAQLVLKRLVKTIVDGEVKLAGEAQVLAWLTDLYKARLGEPDFRAELGYLWGTLSTVRYEDPTQATAYYSSVFILAQAQALQRIDQGQMRQVRARVIVPIYQQLSDFVELRRLEGKKEGEGGTGEEERQRQMHAIQIVLFSYEQAKMFVDRFVEQ